jgi:type IV pilus assembly protein PilN
MIRINLLPFRAARKKENIRRQVSIYFLSVIFLISLMAYFLIDLNGSIARLQREKEEKTRELATFAETNKKLDEIKRKLAEITKKLEVIRGLEKNKTGPVHLLDEIATAVPRDKLWLRSLEEKRGLLNIEGTAMDNDTVALFMDNLKRSPHILEVDLNSTKLRQMPEIKLNVTEFILKCKTYSFKEETPKPAAGTVAK